MSCTHHAFLLEKVNWNNSLIFSLRCISLPIFPSPPAHWPKITFLVAQFLVFPSTGLGSVGSQLCLKCSPIYFLVWEKKKQEKADFFPTVPLDPTIGTAEGAYNHSGRPTTQHKHMSHPTTWCGSKVYPVLKCVPGDSRMFSHMVS